MKVWLTLEGEEGKSRFWSKSVDIGEVLSKKTEEEVRVIADELAFKVKDILDGAAAKEAGSKG